MFNTSSVTQQLNWIRELLTHPAIDPDKIERRIKTIFRQVGYTKRPLITRVERVIRATKNQDEKWFDSVSKFDYPPPRVIGLGRCNRAGEQVFYCSNDNAIPVFEVRPNIGDYVALSTWGPPDRTKIEFISVALGVQHLVDNLEEDESLRRVLLQDEIFQAGTRPELKELDAFVGDMFSQEAEACPNLYWFTNAVTKTFLGMKGRETGNQLDGIIYPSVAGKLKGYNIMLTKDFRDKKLEMASVYVYRVEDISDTKDYKLLHKKSLIKARDNDLTWDNEPFNGYFEFNPDIPAQDIRGI